MGDFLQTSSPGEIPPSLTPEQLYREEGIFSRWRHFSIVRAQHEIAHVFPGT